jgi:hypothetical protein
MAVFWLGGLLFLALPAEALVVTLDPSPTERQSLVWIHAKDHGGGSTSVSDRYVGSLPFVDSHTAFNDPGATSTTSYDFSESAFTISVDEHLRPANLGAIALSSGHVYFSVDMPTQYTISGIYQALNPPEARLHIAVTLREAENDEFLYRTILISQNTANETLEVGVGGGDTLNFEDGARTGQLEPGREYLFIHTLETLALVTPTGAASASGVVQLALSSTPAVPALRSTGFAGLAVALLGVGLAGLGVQPRRRAWR